MNSEHLDEIEARAKAFAKYHDEHARFGGASREFHAWAGSFLNTDVPELVTEVRRLREQKRCLRVALADLCSATAELDEVETIRHAASAVLEATRQ